MHLHHHHFAVRFVTGPKLSPKRVLQREKCSAFSFNFQYLLLSLKNTVAVYVFILFFPPLYRFFNNMFYKADSVQNVTNPGSLPSYYCMKDVHLFLESLIFLNFPHDQFS